MAVKILVVDDDTSFCIMIATFLEKKGYAVSSAFSVAGAIELINSERFDVILTDLRLPDSDGLEVLKNVKSLALETQVILMTGYADIRTAVQAIKAGAFDYVSKPINADEILHKIEHALKRNGPVAPAKPAHSEVSNRFVKGVSADANKLHEYIKLVAPTNMSVIITGDSGTGKEHIAHLIHSQSKRNDKPFIAVDCGAIPKDLAASEFFGHIKGSFTGAVTDKTGHFEAADGGTVFLDEVGNLSYDVQIQLLRALQERRVKPVGSNHDVSVDIRVIAATNEDLAEAVRKGEFREDLYHRLNEFSIRAPRLAERRADIMIFAEHFLDEANSDLERNITGFESNVITLFQEYEWPGNLREMKNVIKRAVLLSSSERISLDDLPHEMVHWTRQDYRQNEEAVIRKALAQANFNKSKAAKFLNIDRKTLYNKLKLYNIDL